MGESEETLLKAIQHYQGSLERNTEQKNNAKILHCIQKLHKLPIKISHLESTGVGRSVNGLRKLGGEVGDAAKSLVLKWKEMVVEEENEEQEEEEEPENDSAVESANTSYSSDYNEELIKIEEKENREKQKENSRNSIDTNRKHSEKSHKTKEKEDKNKEKENKSKRHKSEKRKRDASESENNRSNSDAESEEDRIKSKKIKSNSDSEEESNHKRKSKHRKNGDSDSENSDQDKKNKSKKSKKHKSHKRDSSEEEHRSKSKHKKSKHKSSKRSHSESEDEKKSSKKDSNKHKSSKKVESDNDDNDDGVLSPVYSHSARITEENEKLKHKKAETKHKKDDSERKDKKNEHKSDKHKNSSEESHKSDKHKKSTEESSLKRDRTETKKDSSSSSKKDKDRHKEKKEKEASSHKKEKSSSSKSHSSSSSKPKNPERIINGIDSESGLGFAEALGMCGTSSLSKSVSIGSPSKKKTSTREGSHTTRESSQPARESSHSASSGSSSSRKETYSVEDNLPKLLKEPITEPIDLNISSLLPSITPNYRPLGNFTMDSIQKKASDYEDLSRVISSKNQRTKVYSGNKVYGTKIPSLYELCIRILQDHIDALEFTGGVPYSILKPILDKATPEQLFQLEHHNPYLIEDSDELWLLHCQKRFRTKKREELESWREMYLRCLDEQDAKLKALTANIKESQVKSLPVRTTKMAYVDSFVKPPRNIARKQMKNGTAFDKKPAQSPSSRLSTIATSGEAAKVAVPNPGRAPAERSVSSAAIKTKKAPLMAKTLSFMKNRFKR